MAPHFKPWLYKDMLDCGYMAMFNHGYMTMLDHGCMTMLDHGAIYQTVKTMIDCGYNMRSVILLK